MGEEGQQHEGVEQGGEKPPTAEEAAAKLNEVEPDVETTQETTTETQTVESSDVGNLGETLGGDEAQSAAAGAGEEEAPVEGGSAAQTDDLNEQGGPLGIQAEVDHETGEQHPPSDPPPSTATPPVHPSREEREEANRQAHEAAREGND